jgi:hypothetical protein
MRVFVNRTQRKMLGTKKEEVRSNRRQAKMAE